MIVQKKNNHQMLQNLIVDLAARTGSCPSYLWMPPQDDIAEAQSLRRAGTSRNWLMAIPSLLHQVIHLVLACWQQP